MTETAAAALSIGLLLFPNLTQLDLTGPYEVFARIPGARVRLVWKRRDPVVSERGMALVPDTTFDGCPPLDILCIPGGPGQIDLMDDSETLAFVRRMAAGCRFVTSVCTGSLVLGAAGLLRGYRATSHWASRDQLALLGAQPVEARVVFDRNRVTGGGVTSGIDFALAVVAHLYGEAAAQRIQLQLEYDPAPPFRGGSPASASPEIVAQARQDMAPMLARRLAATRAAAARLEAGA
ncbi:DJ-1/PfpI family protein [Ralstonia solanacearum]|uniref:Thiamine biosynthesis protein ThiJ n=3 Tax=Ralstonia solanacearum TaxID=305 RepID=A0A5H2Q616_RALSL|nr:DJ-1/PfpI family protein [Ralstonia solanacearum]AEG71760.1 putative transcription regulator protein, ThiJ/PfpI [Ralstonia solanacearum Po82]AMP71650.1 thiamine biosynthesis protein ThiJ [Ralstonia solanacearum]AMP76423.1 thiamine biosynthesis protein ThiJ [Ralstonia solanacearum]AYB63063.1 thiamine biosynthesis protein ThiJ [Ralstonia solanacearum]EUJ12377.1 dimethylglycine dehydrogenase [Ralstonia solanacearum P673]